jgi:hypothetical protein
MPPPRDPDGGWPAMRAAGERIVAQVGRTAVEMVGLPGFKNADAVAFPIQFAGGAIARADGHFVATTIVVACDRLFEDVIGGPCGGRRRMPSS